MPRKEQRFIAVRMARWSATHPWRAVLAWFVFVITCVGIGAMTGTNDVQGRDFWVGEAGHAEEVATEAGLPRPIVEKVLITPRAGSDPSATERAAEDVRLRMSQAPEVSKVGDTVRSPDGNALLVPLTMAGDEKAADENVTAVLERTGAVQSAHPASRIEQTGDASTGHGVDERTGKDLSRAEAITLPVTVLILLIVFGSILAAGIPVLLAMASVFAAMGLYAVATYLVPDPGGAVSNVILMIGLAVGVDYSLFYLNRVREERARTGGMISHAAAVELAAATAGRTIIVSGLAVLVPLIGLYIANDTIFSGIATGSILVVAVAMTSSLTVLPALLAKLGRWTDRWRLFRRAERSTRWWPTLLRPATRHPLITVVIAVALLVGLALPALNLRISSEGTASYPRSVPAVQTWDRLTEAFPAEGNVHMVVVRADAAHSSSVQEALRDTAHRAAADPLFAPSEPPEIRTSGGVSTLEIPFPFGTGSEHSEESLRELRTEILPTTLGSVPGADYAVGGEAARNVDTIERQAGAFGGVAGFVLVLTFLMMLAAFRSVVIGLLVVSLNLLSAAAAFGALVAVFQYSWAEGLLGFTSTGFIGSHIPLILFVVLFGLSMDYQVFMLSRIREAVERGVSSRQAVADGITSSAGVVTSAAFIMVSVFAAFVFADLVELKQTGFGLAFAVLVDALIVRVLILPALLTLFGRVSWWPSRTARRARTASPPEAVPRPVSLR